MSVFGLQPIICQRKVISTVDFSILCVYTIYKRLPTIFWSPDTGTSTHENLERLSGPMDVEWRSIPQRCVDEIFACSPSDHTRFLYI